MIYRFMRGRFTFKVYVLLAIVKLLIISWYFFPQHYLSLDTTPTAVPARTSRHLSKLITVVFRQFEEFENDVADSVQSFVSAFPNMPVLVVCKGTPYPPFPFSATNETLRNVKVVSLELRLDSKPRDLNPLAHIFTEYVLFVPDSTRVSRRVLQQAMTASVANPKRIIAIGVGNSHLICQQVKWDFTNWTLQYSKAMTSSLCDAVHGQHSLLLTTSMLASLPKPFMMPFPESMYLQSSQKGIKAQILDVKLTVGRNVMKTPVSKQKVARSLRDSRIMLYKELGIKAVMREDSKVQWFGCRRETQRCFPSVQGAPSYILSGRNTPPCCRRNIRRTVNHVLQALTTAGARCWLETTSLLGAVIRGDILPWAEYGEVGIHVADVARVERLGRGGLDADGFLWERATKGRYYRVAYSSTNRVYALVLPFAPRNGSMWPADWVLAHQRAFPERHLHPLAQITFADQSAPAPNDARAFLDLKLGRHSVERCQKIGPKLIYP